MGGLQAIEQRCDSALAIALHGADEGLTDLRLLVVQQYEHMFQSFIGAKGREHLEGQITALDIFRLERPQQGRIQAGDTSSSSEFLQLPQSGMAHLDLRMVEG